LLHQCFYSFRPYSQSQVFFFCKPHITPGCNHARQIVAITHLFSFFLSLCSHRNKPAIFAITHFSFCNHLLPRLAIIFQITK
jgi:hypothetical protein